MQDGALGNTVPLSSQVTPDTDQLLRNYAASMRMSKADAVRYLLSRSPDLRKFAGVKSFDERYFPPLQKRGRKAK